MQYWKELSQTDSKGTMDPFSQQSNNSLYDYNPEEETFSDTKNTQIEHFAKKASKAAKGNQKAKTARLTKVMKLQIIIKKPIYRLKQLQDH